MNVMEKIFFVSLTEDQIKKAKAVHGQQFHITHAVVCGKYGQWFGTKKQCEKYYSAWEHIYRESLFDDSAEISTYEFKRYDSDDLTGILMKADDKVERQKQKKQIAEWDRESKTAKTGSKKGFIAQLFDLLLSFTK